jgi:hypothetical protein
MNLGIGLNINDPLAMVSASVLGGQNVSAAATAPSAPRNLTDNGSGGINQEAISWTAPLSNGGSAITGYNVYVNIDSGGGYGGFNLYVSLGVVLTTTTPADPGSSYQVKVTAINAVGESVYSNTITYSA